MENGQIARILHALCAIFAVLALSSPAPAQGVPKVLWGEWMIGHDLPTTTISCWGEPEIKKLVGTKIEYSADFFRWQTISVNHPVVETKVVTAEQFAEDNSAVSVNGSQVDFDQIGIRAKSAKQITINHPAANISNSTTTEIPGDKVWVKNPDTIIFSVCNVYFEARRVKPKSKQVNE